MRVKIFQDGNKNVVEFKPILLKNNAQYKFNNRGKPLVWYTATSKMVDFIGNVTSINKNKCEVRGVYSGKMQNIKNIRIVDCAINRIGERVMITEHVNIFGKFELIATKCRILYGDTNFINVGYPEHYAIVDIYTGEHRIVGE
jgi:hypothetical protein